MLFKNVAVILQLEESRHVFNHCKYEQGLLSKIKFLTKMALMNKNAKKKKLTFLLKLGMDIFTCCKKTIAIRI